MEAALDEALTAGYRHIDAAPVYMNEKAIGRVLKKWLDSSNINREDLFVTTKIPPPGKLYSIVCLCLFNDTFTSNTILNDLGVIKYLSAHYVCIYIPLKFLKVIEQVVLRNACDNLWKICNYRMLICI